VKIIVFVVDNSRYAAYRLPIAPGDKKFGLRILVKRMFRPIKKFLRGDLQLRNPLRVIQIDRPG